MALAFAGALLIYGSGAAPTVLRGDSAELQAVGALGGVAHQTGYPAYILVARLFTSVPSSDPARRVTLLSVVCAALALTLVVRLGVALGLTGLGGLLAAMVFGSTFTFWCAAQRSEVYTLAFCLFLLAAGRTRVALASGRARDAMLAALGLGLTMSGHFMFAPMVIVLGLLLAWRVGVRGHRAPLRLAGMLAAFLLGLSPYLYLMWVDTQSHPLDYLRLVDLANDPALAQPAFDTPFERVTWLMFGRNSFPMEPYVFRLRTVVLLVIRGLVHLAALEPGPVALLLAGLGAWRLWRAERGKAVLVVVLAGLSIAFTSLFGDGGRMSALFLLPAVLVLSFAAAWGLDAAARTALAQRGQARVLGAGALLLVPVLISIVAQFDRLRLGTLPPARLLPRIEAEEPWIRVDTWIPSLRGFDEPRRYGESALALAPRGALMVTGWRDLTTLAYLIHVEGRRPDLTLQPLAYPNMLRRLSDWQTRHRLADRPFVFLSGREPMGPHLRAPDSVRTATGEWLVIERQPLVGLPPPTPTPR